FPLHHAWSIDRTVELDGASVSLPGVATVLNNIYHPDSGGRSNANGDRGAGAGAAPNVQRVQPMATVSGAADQGVRPPLPGGGAAGAGGLGAMGLLAGLTGQASSMLKGAVGNSGPRQDSQDRDDDQQLPVIEADQRTNSVLVR